MTTPLQTDCSVGRRKNVENRQAFRKATARLKWHFFTVANGPVFYAIV